MVLKRFKLHQFLMVWHELFLHTSMGVGRGAGIWNLQQKKAVFLVSSGKKQISPLLAPLEKLLEKSNSALLEKILPTPMHTNM